MLHLHTQMTCAVFTSWSLPEHCYVRFRVLIKIDLTFTCTAHQMHRGMASEWRPLSLTAAASRRILKGPKVWCPMQGQESMNYFWMRALMEQNDTRKKMLGQASKWANPQDFRKRHAWQCGKLEFCNVIHSTDWKVLNLSLRIDCICSFMLSQKANKNRAFPTVSM